MPQVIRDAEYLAGQAVGAAGGAQTAGRAVTQGEMEQLRYDSPPACDSGQTAPMARDSENQTENGVAVDRNAVPGRATTASTRLPGGHQPPVITASAKR